MAEVLDLIRSLAHERGVTVLLSSHLLHQVHQVCDRVAIFRSGRILAQGPMSKLAEQLAGGGVELEVGVDGPADQVSAALLATPGVRTATRDQHDPRLWRVAGAPSIRERLARDLAGRGMSVWQLRRIGDDLDEIYMRYFAKDEVQDGRAA